MFKQTIDTTNSSSTLGLINALQTADADLEKLRRDLRATTSTVRVSRVRSTSRNPYDSNEVLVIESRDESVFLFVRVSNHISRDAYLVWFDTVAKESGWNREAFATLECVRVYHRVSSVN